jgi:REP element-mobilizing transposase RayT
MARPPRVDFPGARHHVMNRGAHRAPIFRHAGDRWLFLKLLRQMEDRHGVEVRAYALMPNHFHLLLVSRTGRLSQAMQDLQGRFAGYIHATTDRDGSMFRGRFRSRLVDETPYWRHLFAYIHLNPHRLDPSLVNSPLWTSQRFLEQGASWLHTSETLATLGGLGAYRRYHQDVLAHRAPPPGFDARNLWGAERWSRGRACQTLSARGLPTDQIAALLGLAPARVTHLLSATAAGARR